MSGENTVSAGHGRPALQHCQSRVLQQEKCGPTSQLNEQQRARLTQNFRAAKALLARKCSQVPGLGSPLNSKFNVHVTDHQDRSPDKKKLCHPRRPLSELPVNTPIQVDRKAISVDIYEHFDDAILEEIDKLCDQKNISTKRPGDSASESSTPSSGDAFEKDAFPTTPSMLDMPIYLQKLNDSQRDAALSDMTKPLLILAGPGSGKTSTMVARLLTLLKEGVSSSNILAMTFTTAAATEMRERVGAVVGKGISKELPISTFHSFCLQLCRSHAEKLGRTPEFLIYGTSQQRKAVIEATRLAFAEKSLDVGVSNELNPAVWRDKAKKWQQFVTQSKASGKTLEEIESTGNTLGAAVFKHYDAILESCNALDYHDFISFAVKLLSDRSDVLEEYHRSCQYILVDEFQDTSAMQYKLLQLLASHNRVTVVGDDDQSIFSFNGANSLGFDSFRKDFPEHKEVRLQQNYRSTRCIVEAATCLIQNNFRRCNNKHAQTDNLFGDKIVVRECRNEEAQCALAVDEILRNASSDSHAKPAFANFAILYRRQVTGRMFQTAFRARKIPFNMHGVAFYRKKVIKNVIALLWTALQANEDIFGRRVFKALYSSDKAETRKAVEYVEKQARCANCSFLKAAENIFTAKVSGTFSRRQLTQGRKILSTMEMVQRLVNKEQSLSSLMTAVVNLLPQKPAFEARAVVDESGGKLLNEDDDPRTVLDYLLDDVSDFLSNQFKLSQQEMEDNLEQPGCLMLLKAFLDHITVRETENFRARREENHNSVTLTTMHQSKGLEWDTVFIVKANELETPLLQETGMEGDTASLEEERRLFYVAMTRARKRLHILYIVVNPQRQILQPSRFLKELPRHLLHFEGSSPAECDGDGQEQPIGSQNCEKQNVISWRFDTEVCGGKESGDGFAFLRSFNVEARSTVASLFHNWARKPAFQDPKRLLNKIGFVIDERLRSKNVKGKDILHALKCSLTEAAALQYACHVVKWEKLPIHERAVLQAERQEHFQQKCSERAMSSAAATSKQITFLRSLGCTISPSSRLHASKLIEQYKAL